MGAGLGSPPYLGVKGAPAVCSHLGSRGPLGGNELLNSRSPSYFNFFGFYSLLPPFWHTPNVIQFKPAL